MSTTTIKRKNARARATAAVPVRRATGAAAVRVHAPARKAAAAPAAASIIVRTPAGPITLTPRASAANPSTVLRDVKRFVRGERPDFSTYATPEGTAFQRKCWAACRSIPYGETRTYAWLAKKAGSPNAARAAGQAMRRNPMPVVVPCHRVVGSSGWIGGFAGDSRPTGASVDLKRWLIELEQG